MRSQKQINISIALKKVWKERREELMEHRNNNKEQIKQLQHERIIEHFQKHPEHREAISLAQKQKWVKIGKALKYCKDNKINLDEKKGVFVNG